MLSSKQSKDLYTHIGVEAGMLLKNTSSAWSSVDALLLVTRVNSYTCVDNSRKEIRQRVHVYLNLDPMCKKKTFMMQATRNSVGPFTLRIFQEVVEQLMLDC